MKDKITKIINKVGIKDVGFCAFSEISHTLLDCRAKERLPEGAKTVILLIFPYKVREEKPQGISRYAAVPDYHKVCGEYLKKCCAELEKHIDGYEFVCFADNSPLPEVLAAAKAGLGKIGENGLLITEKFGSYVFIGEIVTDFALELPQREIEHCSNCGKCKEFCPKDKYGDCLSNISQKKGLLNETEEAALKDHNILWGCDICSAVCPENDNAQNTYIKEFIEGYRDTYTLDEDISGRAYEWRGEKTVKRNYLNLNGK